MNRIEIVPKEFNTLSLSVIVPSLISEWVLQKNDFIPPDQVAATSIAKVWWRCDKGHKWQARIIDRVRNGNGCPYCAGRKVIPSKSLAILRPDLAEGWHPKKNGTWTPYDVSPRSKRMVWWLCDKGHEWLSSVRSRKKGCTHCKRIVKRDNSLKLGKSRE